VALWPPPPWLVAVGVRGFVKFSPLLGPEELISLSRQFHKQYGQRDLLSTELNVHDPQRVPPAIHRAARMGGHTQLLSQPLSTWLVCARSCVSRSYHTSPPLSHECDTKVNLERCVCCSTTRCLTTTSSKKASTGPQAHDVRKHSAHDTLLSNILEQKMLSSDNFAKRERPPHTHTLKTSCNDGGHNLLYWSGGCPTSRISIPTRAGIYTHITCFNLLALVDPACTPCLWCVEGLMWVGVCAFANSFSPFEDSAYQTPHPPHHQQE
jgi:hypothetical protein